MNRKTCPSHEAALAVASGDLIIWVFVQFAVVRDKFVGQFYNDIVCMCV